MTIKQQCTDLLTELESYNGRELIQAYINTSFARHLSLTYYGEDCSFEIVQGYSKMILVNRIKNLFKRKP